eukprot:GHVR01034386.1.p1 GENE.GHVR01034386.1~~GHVR01034386.1.p1  ORF type:complete len:176 (+),score=20.97 GHVR01034386.1:150-677(+)
MGCVGGFIWNFVKGARNSTKGKVLSTALFSAKSRAPLLGGSFSLWGGTYSSFDCSLQYIRGKEDYWNAIASGAMTGGTLAIRNGWKVASRHALVGGVLLAVIEGVSALLIRRSALTPREQMIRQMEYEKEEKERLAKASQTPPQASLGMFDFFKRDNTVEAESTTQSNFLTSDSH